MTYFDTIKRSDVTTALGSLRGPSHAAESSLTALAMMLQDTWQKEIVIRLWQSQGQQVAELDEAIRRYGGRDILNTASAVDANVAVEDWVDHCLFEQTELLVAYTAAINSRLPTDIVLMLQRHQLRRGDLMAHLQSIKRRNTTLQSA